MDGGRINRISTEQLATENLHNSSHKCYMFSAAQLHHITTVTIMMYFSAVVMCTLCTAVIFALRRYRTFVHRLLVYLMIIAFFHGISAALEVVPVQHNGRAVEVRHGLNGVCSAIGFAVQVTDSQLLMLCTWIVVYLVLLVVFQYQANSKRHEIVGLMLSLGLPLTYNWLPFVQELYGLAGPWCWIRTTNNECSVHIKLGVIYQFTLFYGPQVVIILVSFISFLVIVTTIRKRSLDHSRETSQPTFSLPASSQGVPSTSCVPHSL